MDPCIYCGHTKVDHVRYIVRVVTSRDYAVVERNRTGTRQESGRVVFPTRNRRKADARAKQLNREWEGECHCGCNGWADEPSEADLERYTFGTPPIDPAPMRSELTR